MHRLLTTAVSRAEGIPVEVAFGAQYHRVTRGDPFFQRSTTLRAAMLTLQVLWAPG